MAPMALSTTKLTTFNDRVVRELNNANNVLPLPLPRRRSASLGCAGIF